MANAIEVENIQKKFGDFVAVNDLSFEVPQGKIFGFLGPNGSGKSTTLRMILGLIKTTKGEIRLFDKNLKTDRAEIMKRVGCIIEKPDFYKYLSAHENLKLFARANQVNYSQQDYRDLYNLVGLTDREKDKVKTYSHGMKQRLGIAQALIHNPDLIILDEPNTGLDPKGIIELRELIIKLNKEHGKTVLFSSHILSEVEEVCDSLVVINKGKAVAQGKVSELLSNEDLLVDVEVGDAANCLTVIKESQYQQFYRSQNENVLRFNLPKEDLAKMNTYLVQKGVSVLSSTYRKRLEDYFLRITENK